MRHNCAPRWRVAENRALEMCEADAVRKLLLRQWIGANALRNFRRHEDNK